MGIYYLFESGIMVLLIEQKITKILRYTHNGIYTKLQNIDKIALRNQERQGFKSQINQVFNFKEEILCLQQKQKITLPPRLPIW